MRNRGLDIIYGFLVITFFAVLLMSLGFYIDSKDKLARDDFCVRQGYSESTDVNNLQGNIIRIECDHKEIFKAFRDSSCLEKDKWGDCQKSVAYYIPFVSGE